jgi:hypothetical protein
MNFSDYLLGTVIKPNVTFNWLASDSKKLTQSFRAILLIGALYTLTVIGLAVIGADISSPAWMSIPADEYYFWEIFLAMPVVVLGWIMAAGVAQLLSKLFGGSGNFEATLAVLGFAVTVPMFVTWIPETVGTILMVTGVMTQTDWLEMTSKPGFWQVFGLAYQLVAVAWCAFLFPVAIAQSQRLRWWRAIIVGVATLAVFGLAMFTFIR